MRARVAFQGERGAYSEEAVFAYFGEDVEAIPLQRMREVFESVVGRRVDYAAVPLENSLEGGVNEVMGCLRDFDVMMMGEATIKINHCFICAPKANREEIRFVYSHPQALGQCQKFIRESDLRAIPFYDTAGSVKEIVGRFDAGAIASKRAAHFYKMKVLEEGIQDDPNNYTRFAIITNRQQVPERTGADKTSIVFSLPHRPGQLYRALEAFARFNINLTRIESRPAPGGLWEYDFFVDFEGHTSDEAVREALGALGRQGTFLKILGSYPKGTR